MGNYINEIQKYKYYDKIKKKGLTRECPICGDVVRRDQDFEIIIRKNKQKRIYHRGCIIEEISMKANVYSSLFHPEELQLDDYEKVNLWKSFGGKK